MQVGGHIVRNDGVIHRNIGGAILIGVSGLVGVEPLFGVGIHGGEGAAGGSVPQQADLLILIHQGQQVFRTLLAAQAPVFIGVQLAVGV